MPITSKAAREFIEVNAGDRLAVASVKRHAIQIQAEMDSDADEDGIFHYYTNQPECGCCEEKIEPSTALGTHATWGNDYDYFSSHALTWATVDFPTVDTIGLCDDCAASFEALIKAEGVPSAS